MMSFSEIQSNLKGDVKMRCTSEILNCRCGGLKSKGCDFLSVLGSPGFILKFIGAQLCKSKWCEALSSVFGMLGDPPG